MRALVTGARGFAGSWLAKALLEDGCGGDLARPRAVPPPAVSSCRGSRATSTTSSATCVTTTPCCDLLRRELGSTPSSTSPPSRSSATRTPPPSRPSRRTSREPGCCSRPAGRPASRGSSWPPRTRPTGPTSELPYTEDSALQPIFPYDVSKAATDLIARSYWHTYGLPVAVTRFANLYGGGERNFSRLIPETVTRRARRTPPGDSLRRLPRARLPLRRGRCPRVSGDRRGARRADVGGRGVQRRLGPAASRSRGGRSDLRARARRTSSPTTRAPGTRAGRSTGSTSTRPRSASGSAGSRRWTCARASAGRSSGTRAHPEVRPVAFV